MASNSSVAAIWAALGACLSLSGLAVGQIPISHPAGSALFTWNAATASPFTELWIAERPQNRSFPEGLRWAWQRTDGMGNVVPPEVITVCDDMVPGIAGAFQFPQSRAATNTPNLTDSWGDNWQNQSLNNPGREATFEIWFRPADLMGTHVLWEIGAVVRGVAFALEDDELIYAAAGTNAGGASSYATVHRETLTDTDWHQAVIVLDYVEFEVRLYLDGVEVNVAPISPAAGYVWANANQAGLGTLGGDPAQAPSIAAEPVPAGQFESYDGMIAIHRYYTAVLSDAEVLANYNAITDAAAAARRGDYNDDGTADDADQLAMVQAMEMSTTAPFGSVRFPFPAAPLASSMTADPVLAEAFTTSYVWHKDSGGLGTGTNPNFIFPAFLFLTPRKNIDLSAASVRQGFVLDGTEGLNGPNFEFIDDGADASARVQLWLRIDDLAGTHCFFELGGTDNTTGGGQGIAVYSDGDEVIASVNTSSDDGLDRVDLSGGPGSLTTGWHLFEVIVRGLTADGVGEGFELYIDGQLAAAVNDLPGPDTVFGTGDDIDLFNAGNGGTNNFINGNPSAIGWIGGTAPLPSGITTGSVTPFNGLVGPFRVSQSQPTPSDVAQEYADATGQDVVNARLDANNSGAVNFFDVLKELSDIDAGR
ncbi:MAG: LamG-like jellyroll fold domain-containing protein [Planctomycetota bacterium]